MGKNSEVLKLTMAIARLSTTTGYYGVGKAVVKIEHHPKAKLVSMGVYRKHRSRLDAVVRTTSTMDKPHLITSIYFIEDSSGVLGWLKRRHLIFILRNALNQIISEAYEGQHSIGDTDVCIDRVL